MHDWLQLYGNVEGRFGKNPFLVNSEIWGIQIWRKKHK